MKKKALIYICLLSLICISLCQNRYFFFAEEEIVFGFCEEPNILKVLVFISALVTIIKILVPVILIVIGTKDLMIAVTFQDNNKLNQVKINFLKKIIIGLSIFLVPTLIGSFLNYLVQYDGTSFKLSSCGTCLFSTSKCIKLADEAKIKAEEKLNSEAENYEIVRQKSVQAANEALQKAYENLSVPSYLSVTDYYSDGYSYGLGCTSFVGVNTYNETIAQTMLTKGKKKIGTKYSEMDCSQFTKYVYKGYFKGSSAAAQAKELRAKCVPLSEVKPGDIFFTSNYTNKGKCTRCNGSTFGDRCKRWNCILHTGIISKVENGKITQILHSSTGGVKTKNGSGYGLNGAGSGGSSWYIMIVRPYV